MINIIKFVITGLVLMGLLSCASALLSSDSTDIRITLISQEPDPVEPWGYADVRFRIENYGSALAPDISVKLVPKYPFSLQPGDDAEKSIGSLNGIQLAPEGVIVKYRLLVDESAVEGSLPVELWYKFGTMGEWIKPEEFDINVRTYDIVLAVDSVSSTPEIIPPGATARVNINLKNLADSYVKDIKVRLDLSSSALPFVPVHSTTEKKIYQIASMKEDIIYFDIMATADADSGAYKIPLNISYSDNIGTYYSKNDIISLIVGDKPDLTVTMDSSEIYKKNSYGKIAVKFVNKGLSNIKLLNVKLQETDGLEIISPAEVYIGNIDSDDYETAEFSIYVGNKDKLNLQVKLDYMDANNKEFSETRTVELKLFSSGEAKKYGLEESKAVGVIIVILIVVGGIYLFYWRKRKKKR